MEPVPTTVEIDGEYYFNQWKKANEENEKLKLDIKMLEVKLVEAMEKIENLKFEKEMWESIAEDNKYDYPVRIGNWEDDEEDDYYL